jgi:hypothetical protein
VSPVRTDGPWQLRASCAGQPPNIWHWAAGVGHGDAERARRICLDCPVRLHCGAAAVRDKDTHTIRAGFDLTTREGRDALGEWVDDPTGPTPPLRRGSAITATHCRRCRKPFRPPGPRVPGHVLHSGHGLCGTCYRFEHITRRPR